METRDFSEDGCILTKKRQMGLIFLGMTLLNTKLITQSRSGLEYNSQYSYIYKSIWTETILRISLVGVPDNEEQTW
jgi:hypothetical protein